MAVFGYARVSTDGQTLASQEAELMAACCAKVYSEKVSGARTDRLELAKVMRLSQSSPNVSNKWTYFKERVPQPRVSSWKKFAYAFHCAIRSTSASESGRGATTA